MNKTQVNAQLKATGDARTFTARITTDSIDRDGEVLLPSGLDAKDYLKNPVVFWNHNYDVPIGRASELKQHDDHWTATATLSSNEEGEKIHKLIQEGIVNGVSVGFLPTEHRNPSDKDKQKFGESVTRVYSKWRLLEFSVTPLPCNQDALITSVSKMIGKGDLTIDDAARLLEIDGKDIVEPVKRRRVIVPLYPQVQAAPRVSKAQRVEKAVRRAIARKLGQPYA